MPNEARISMSLRKRPCSNRYPGRPGTRSPSATDPAPILGDLMEAISLTFAFCSVSEDAARRQDISLLETHQPITPPPPLGDEMEVRLHLFGRCHGNRVCEVVGGVEEP